MFCLNMFVFIYKKLQSIVCSIGIFAFKNYHQTCCMKMRRNNLLVCEFQKFCELIFTLSVLGLYKNWSTVMGHSLFHSLYQLSTQSKVRWKKFKNNSIKKDIIMSSVELNWPFIAPRKKLFKKEGYIAWNISFNYNIEIFSDFNWLYF